MIDQKEIGRKIRQYRKMKGLTQEQLAELVDKSTMSIRRYESGERVIYTALLDKIANVLDIPPNEFGYILLEFRNGGREEVFTLSDGDMVSMYPYTSEAKLLRAFARLNAQAQEIALERVEELSKIPEYQKETAPDAANIESGEGDTDH